ncbi:MAG: hypothetical protein ACKOYK_06390 [Cyanobium sp.]
MRLNGRPIRPRQTVRLVVNSFLAQGGDGFIGLQKGRDPVGGPWMWRPWRPFCRATRRRIPGRGWPCCPSSRELALGSAGWPAPASGPAGPGASG